jgi:hypothetical protein
LINFDWNDKFYVADHQKQNQAGDDESESPELAFREQQYANANEKGNNPSDHITNKLNLRFVVPSHGTHIFAFRYRECCFDCLQIECPSIDELVILMLGWGEEVFSLSRRLKSPRLAVGLQVFSPVGAVVGPVLPVWGGRV